MTAISSQLLVVSTAELRAVLHEYIEAIVAERPFNINRKNEFTSAIDILTREAEIPPRQLWRILHLESKFTGLDLADRLLTAAGLNHTLGSGRIHVVPNPYLSAETWRDLMAKRGCEGY